MWRKRGRPRSTDKICWKSFIEKKKERLVVHKETLDIYLRNNIISSEEHKCGMRLRWLYTLRFGVPTLQTKLLQHQGFESRYNDEKWLGEMQQQYKFLIHNLQKNKVAQIVIGVCIFNEIADGLKRQSFTLGMKILQDSFKSIHKID